MFPTNNQGRAWKVDSKDNPSNLPAVNADCHPALIQTGCEGLGQLTGRNHIQLAGGESNTATLTPREERQRGPARGCCCSKAATSTYERERGTPPTLLFFDRSRGPGPNAWMCAQAFDLRAVGMDRHPVPRS